MELKDCRFHWGGDDLRFAFFSDGPCRAQYLRHVLLPIAQMRVEIYEIKPAGGTQWVVVKQKDGENETCKLFVKTGETFQENVLHAVSSELKSEILRRFPKLTLESRSLDRRAGHRFQTGKSAPAPSSGRVPPNPSTSGQPSLEV